MTERSGVINARFRSRSHPSGVDRTANEIVSRLAEPDELLPRFSSVIYHNVWEQSVLPLRAVNRPWLLSLANSGPLAARNHVVMIHDASHFDHPEWFSRGYRLKATALHKSWAHTAKMVLTVSQFSKERLQENLGIQPSRIVVVRNGVEDCRPNTASRQPGRVLAVSNLEPRKNLQQLLQAWPKIVRALPNAELRIVGATAESRIFSSNQLGPIPDNVEMLGYLSDEELNDELGQASMLVSTSRYEGFNLPPAEALLRGTPIVLSDIPVHREIFADLASFVPLDDQESLASSIISGATGDPLPVELVAKAKRMFDWETAASQVASILESLTLGNA